MADEHPGQRLIKRSYGPLASRIAGSALCLAGVAAIATAVMRFRESGEQLCERQTAASHALIDAAISVTNAIERTVAPAIARTRRLAERRDIARGIRANDRAWLTTACNEAMAQSTEIDAVAVFDGEGRIMAINSVYADGSPIDPAQTARVMDMDFTARNIISRCGINNTLEEVLEFQTTCDITPAFFDSSGLSVAYSVPIIEKGRRIGVVSTRLRFERISSLATSSVAGGHIRLAFVTDGGAFFDEAINARSEEAPIPPAELGTLVGPLARGQSTRAIVERGQQYLGLFRMNAFPTLDGGGIQVMASVDQAWANREAHLDRLLLAGGRGSFGALMLLSGTLVITLGIAAHQRGVLRAAQAAADDANRVKSEFLANMSHEIRTPLTAILGFVDILRDEPAPGAVGPPQIETLNTIHNAGQHLLAVVNDILDLSKIEAQRMTLERIDTSLVQLLVDVESLMRPRATGKGLALRVGLSSPIPDRVYSDPTRLRQILMNLASNAVKFTERGEVAITAGVEGVGTEQRLIVDIVDTGPGMTGEQAARLFTPFVQADNTVTRKHSGTGLGLTISRRLAQLLEGNVTLVQSAPGEGSCFRLQLPVDKVEGAAMATTLESVRSTAGGTRCQGPAVLHGRVLVAEDGADNRRLLAFHLKGAGAAVEMVENGRLALEKLRAAELAGTPYDLLVTDIQMPEMDGYTLARHLRASGCDIPILALTAHAMEEDKRRCLAAGCDDYASKPLDKAALIGQCAQWMGRRSPMGSAHRRSGDVLSSGRGAA